MADTPDEISRADLERSIRGIFKKFNWTNKAHVGKVKKVLFHFLGIGLDSRMMTVWSFPLLKGTCVNL